LTALAPVGAFDPGDDRDTARHPHVPIMDGYVVRHLEANVPDVSEVCAKALRCHGHDRTPM
jgi:hypothetical protein